MSTWQAGVLGSKRKSDADASEERKQARQDDDKTQAGGSWVVVGLSGL